MIHHVNAQNLPINLLLEEELKKATAGTINNGGIYNPGQAWAAIVDREGKVQAVAKVFGSDPWPVGRTLAVIKAFKANAFSIKQFALSTANLYNMAQPNKSMFGIQNSITINPRMYDCDDASNFGTKIILS